MTIHQGLDYTLQNFRRCLFDAEPISPTPSKEWSDDPWYKEQQDRTFIANEGGWAIQQGAAEGTVTGGNVYCLNMAKGSDYFPSLDDAILFLESPGEGKASLM